MFIEPVAVAVVFFVLYFFLCIWDEISRKIKEEHQQQQQVYILSMKFYVAKNK